MDEKGDGFKQEVLIFLDMLKHMKSVNDDEVTEEDRVEARELKAERIQAAKEAAEERARELAEQEAERQALLEEERLAAEEEARLAAEAEAEAEANKEEEQDE